MIIKVDKDGKNVIEEFCDMALKQGGLQNFNQIDLVLKSMELLPVPKGKKDSKSKKPEKTKKK